MLITPGMTRVPWRTTFSERRPIGKRRIADWISDEHLSGVPLCGYHLDVGS